jgi:hypothetical protein
MFRRRTEEDERIVAEVMQELARTPEPQTPLPDPSFIWWKAQLLRRFEAEREATTPIDIGERVHVGAAVLGASALAAGAWDQLPSLAFTPAAGLTMIIGAAVLLSVVALAALDTLRQR